MSDFISGVDLIHAVTDDIEVSMKQHGYVVAYTEEELQKIADLQQSMIEKAFELGREDALSEIVRCKDCKHYNAGFECLVEGYGIERDKDWFCGDAERREE